jgi:hypothetical protein
MAKNNPLQQAMIVSLVRKSQLLSEEKKVIVLAKIPTMSTAKLQELQELIGGEERVLLHPKDLQLEEVLATADEQTLRAMNTLIDYSLDELHKAEKIAGEDQDFYDADTLLRSIT